MVKHGSLLGGVLLVSGTCIGGGMLALPVLTSLGGFIPSLAIFIACWLFMAATGMLLLEVTHWMDGETNLISMAEKTLGKPGKILTWTVYLFFFYCLTLAYIVGSGKLVNEWFSLPEWAGSFVFVALSAPIVFGGARLVGKLNTLLMVGLGLSYLMFFYLGTPYVNSENLKGCHWSLSFYALPIAFASFGYQGIIPTLDNYLDRDIKKTRIAILVGSFLPLIAYIIWEWLILGIVPREGPYGLIETLNADQNAIYPLKNIIDNPSVYIVGQFFAFFALATSFFGVTLGLQDFLADGLKVVKDIKGKTLLNLMVFVPPLAIAFVYPNLFLQALNYAGGFGGAILLGLLPILMVWSGRYKMNLPSEVSLPGGKALLVVLILFVLFELGFEILHLF